MDLPSDQHEEASYIIFKKNGDILARNGDSGNIEFSGTDAATVINNAFDALPKSNRSFPVKGGTVLVKAGTYTLNSAILISDWAHNLVGEGNRATVFKLGSDVNAVEVHGASDDRLRYSLLADFTIDGDDRAYAGNGLDLEYVSNCIIENVSVDRVKGTGARFKSIWDSEVDYLDLHKCGVDGSDPAVDIPDGNTITFDHLAVRLPFWDGIHLGGIHHTFYSTKLHGSDPETTDDDGVLVSNDDNKFLGIRDAAYWDTLVHLDVGACQCIVSGWRVDAGINHAVVIENNADHNLIENGVGDGVAGRCVEDLSGVGTKIKNVTVLNGGSDGIRMAASAESYVIEGCECCNCARDGINVGGNKGMVINCHCYDNKDRAGISIDGGVKNLIVGNEAYDTGVGNQQIGIEEVGTGYDENILVGNKVWGNTSPPQIRIDGANSMLFSNVPRQYALDTTSTFAGGGTQTFAFTPNLGYDYIVNAVPANDPGNDHGYQVDKVWYDTSTGEMKVQVTETEAAGGGDCRVTAKEVRS